MKDDKRREREVKRSVKREGKRARRRAGKRQLDREPDEAPFFRFDLGRRASAGLNAPSPDKKRVRNDEEE